MSILSRLREAKVNPRNVGTRWFTVLEREFDLPAFEVEIQFFSQDDYDRSVAGYKKNLLNLPEMNASQRAEYRKKNMPRFINNWRGLVWGNMERLSEDSFLAREEMARHERLEEIPFGGEELVDLAWLINNQFFNRMLDAAMDQDAWIAERRLQLPEAEEKKDSNSTPA